MSSTTPGKLWRTASEQHIDFSTRPVPAVSILEGKHCIIEAINEKHREELYEASMAHGAETRFKYLPDSVPKSKADFDAWFSRTLSSEDPKFLVVISKASGKVGGRCSYLRIVPEHGVVEIGHIHFTPLIARSTAATEAIYLLAKYVFEDLRYRRLEWKCDNSNERSKRAAHRYGFTFEGVFRQHLIVKGRNRDTAWFAIIDKDWPAIAAAFEHWLDDSNFDEDGMQIRSLALIRVEILKSTGGESIHSG